MIDWLVFYATFSSISAILRRENIYNLFIINYYPYLRRLQSVFAVNIKKRNKMNWIGKKCIVTHLFISPALVSFIEHSSSSFHITIITLYIVIMACACPHLLPFKCQFLIAHNIVKISETLGLFCCLCPLRNNTQSVLWRVKNVLKLHRW